MRLALIREGLTELEVPAPEEFRALSGDYVPSRARVFYNPHMELCRDLAVAVAQLAARELGELSICDPLAGVGVRGLRYAKEVDGVSRVVINDHSSKAREFMERNLELNRPEIEVRVCQKDANILLLENRGAFNYIDLDPYGSPAPFLEAACVALGKRGVLALTATDLAPLCGARPHACVRRYGAKPLKTVYCHELGARILIGFAQRVAGKHELALRPLLVHSTRHYLRVYLLGERRAAEVNEVMKNQGHASHCFACGRRRTFKDIAPTLEGTCTCGTELHHAGPLWLGPLGEHKFVRELVTEILRRSFELSAEEVRLLSLCAEEARGPPLFYDVNELSKLLRKTPASLGFVTGRLRKEGYFASRTHFSPTGFRTDAPFERITASWG